jgi:hypothetical protein
MQCGLLRSIGLAVAAMFCASLLWAADAPATKVGPNGEKLVQVEVKLPKPMFQGTPKNLKASATLEKYDERPRAPFYAPAGTENVAKGKKVTSSDSAPIIGELKMLNDADKEGADGSFVELGPGVQWVQFDLGAPCDVYALVLWHFHAEGRVYHDVIIQVADDPDFIDKVKTVFNNDFDNSAGLGLGKNLEYIEDYRGKLIDVRDEKGNAPKGRYVRLYSNGNTSNDMNHYVEVEILGKPAK